MYKINLMLCYLISFRFEKHVNSEKAAVYNVKQELCQSFLDWFHRFQNTIDGSDSWFDTSRVGNSEYKECKRNPTLSWKSSGYSRILDILMVRKTKFLWNLVPVYLLQTCEIKNLFSFCRRSFQILP